MASYTTKSGDSLEKIAGMFYGNQRYVQALYEANPGAFNSAGYLRQGYKLNIPEFDTKKIEASGGPLVQQDFWASNVAHDVASAYAGLTSYMPSWATGMTAQQAGAYAGLGGVPSAKGGPTTLGAFRWNDWYGGLSHGLATGDVVAPSGYTGPAGPNAIQVGAGGAMTGGIGGPAPGPTAGYTSGGLTQEQMRSRGTNANYGTAVTPGVPLGPTGVGAGGPPPGTTKLTQDQMRSRGTNANYGPGARYTGGSPTITSAPGWSSIVNAPVASGVGTAAPVKPMPTPTADSQMAQNAVGTTVGGLTIGYTGDWTNVKAPMVGTGFQYTTPDGVKVVNGVPVSYDGRPVRETGGFLGIGQKLEIQVDGVWVDMDTYKSIKDLAPNERMKATKAILATQEKEAKVDEALKIERDQTGSPTSMGGNPVRQSIFGLQVQYNGKWISDTEYETIVRGNLHADSNTVFDLVRKAISAIGGDKAAADQARTNQAGVTTTDDGRVGNTTTGTPGATLGLPGTDAGVAVQVMSDVYGDKAVINLQMLGGRFSNPTVLNEAALSTKTLLSNLGADGRVVNPSQLPMMLDPVLTYPALGYTTIKPDVLTGKTPVPSNLSPYYDLKQVNGQWQWVRKNFVDMPVLATPNVPWSGVNLGGPYPNYPTIPGPGPNEILNQTKGWDYGAISWRW